MNRYIYIQMGNFQPALLGNFQPVLTPRHGLLVEADARPSSRRTPGNSHPTRDRPPETAPGPASPWPVRVPGPRPWPCARSTSTGRSARLHIGSTPGAARCGSMNDTSPSVSGRAHFKRKKPTPCVISHWLASVPDSPVPTHVYAHAPNC